MKMNKAIIVWVYLSCIFIVLAIYVYFVRPENFDLNAVYYLLTKFLSTEFITDYTFWIVTIVPNEQSKTQISKNIASNHISEYVYNPSYAYRMKAQTGVEHRLKSFLWKRHSSMAFFLNEISQEEMWREGKWAFVMIERPKREREIDQRLHSNLQLPFR